jgi:ribosomal protein S18 acetylase RimI-like enzyme
MTRGEVQDRDREEVARFIERHWHSRAIMSRGRKFFPHEGPGLIERRDGQIVGLLTYHVEDGAMEILTLNSTIPGAGIGSSLMLDAIEKARGHGCNKVWLTTTNDKIKAIGFYQRLGFRMTAINLGVVDEARKVKPEIPQFGEHNVRIRDEIVMELPLIRYGS